MKINRNRVHASMWVPILAVFVFILFLGAFESIYRGYNFDLIELFGLAGMGIPIGAVVWAPSALICLLIERLAINEATTKSHIMQILFLEALIPFLVFNGLMYRGESIMVFMTFIMAMLAQVARWLYLKRKGKLFANDAQEE